MKIRHIAVLSAALLFAGNALADDGEALFKKNSCSACHNPTNKTVGPSLKAIAEKYKGDASAQAKLEAKVRKGGSGSFGTMAMVPANAKISDADIATMVKWVLATK
jgi:cytochrome c